MSSTEDDDDDDEKTLLSDVGGPSNRYTPRNNNNESPNQSRRPSLTRVVSSNLLAQVERQRSVADNLGIADTVNQYVPDAIATRIPGLIRAETQLKMTYFCNICFTNYPVEQGFTLRRCKHQFCPDCIKGFMTNKIKNGVVHLKCFFPLNQDRPCGAKIDEKDIHQIVDKDIWNKYKKFRANLENTLSRQCPYCDNTQIGDPDAPIMQCKHNECGKYYCLYHSNAHSPDITCEQYELSIAKETKMNEMAIAELGDDVKPCPKCNFRIIKTGGCNHMNCVKCGCSFCWLCLQEIEDEEIPNHYRDPNSPCRGQQFAGMEHEPFPKLLMCWIIIAVTIFCLPSTVLGIVFGIICFMLCCCRSGDDQGLLSCIFGCWIVWLVILILVPWFIFWIEFRIIRAMYEGIRICLPFLPPFPQPLG